MADQFDEASSAQQRADVVMRFFTGTPASKRPTLPVPGHPLVRPRPGDMPQVPLTGNAPTLPTGGSSAPPNVTFVYEPTERLPRTQPPVRTQPAGRPSGDQPAPRVTGRVALIYEQQIRRPWRLWVFTAVLVSLTLGVVLGQAEAYRPPSPRSAAAAEAGGPVSQPPEAVQPPPTAPLTAPLGAITERRLEIVGAATTLRVRTADLGEALLNVTALDQSAVLQMTDVGNGSLLALSGGAAGTVGAEVLLNAKVAWTVKLTGEATELNVDSQAGGLVGVELAAGVSRGVLQLSKPRGVVPIAVTGSVSELTVRTAVGAPVRVRLAKGAGVATVNGKPQRGVKAGARLRETGWPAAKDKYDVRVTADVSTVLVERLAPGS